MSNSSSSSSSGGAVFNAFNALREYFGKMESVSGMKALLLDSETSSITALVYSQTEVIANSTYLIENIETIAWTDDDQKSTFHHLKAIVFIRPTERSVNAFKKFLKSARYKEYYVYFSNIVPSYLLESLAEADENELIKAVHEYYGDFYVVTPSVVHLNNSLRLTMDRLKDYLPSSRHSLLQFQRDKEGVLSICLALRKKPDIRYSAYSEVAKKLAFDVAQTMRDEGEIFVPFQSTAADSLLLIIDRREDPVTPLLTQWTYQAMVHEVLGIKHNRIDIARLKKKREKEEKKDGHDGKAEEKAKEDDLKEVVLSSEQDDFFRSTMFSNYGELGLKIKQLVANFQQLHKTSSKLDSIEDMQKFVENYPEFRKQQGTVSKHVAIMGELLKAVAARKLMDCSAVEQEIVCGNDHNVALDQILKLLEDPNAQFYEKLRIVILYAIRYETYHSSQLLQLKKLLKDKATKLSDQRKLDAVDKVLEYAGERVRRNDLFADKSLVKGLWKNISTGIKGVENIYTQHKTLVHELLTAIQTGELKTQTYPFAESGNPKNKYRNIIVFITGGVTFEESAAVEAITQKSAAFRVVLAGSVIHNSHSFLDEFLPVEAQEEHVINMPAAH